MALVFMGIGFVFGPHWFNVRPGDVGTLQIAFIVAGLGIFFSYYGQFWNILAQVHLDFRFVSILRVLSITAQIGGAILLAALTRNPILIIAWGTLLSAIQLVALIWHARRHFAFGIHWKQARLVRMHEMGSYTGKTFLTLLVNNVLGGIDRLALGRLAAPVDFAHYSICANAGQRIAKSLAIPSPIARAYFIRTPVAWTA